VSESVIKSARRALEVLEYLDEVRSDASVMEIARALNYPQSSTSVLLRSLAGTGYLSYDPHRRRYAPTHRVALLGSWIQAPQLAQGRVLEMMQEISDESFETVILAEQTATIVRYIHVVPSRKEIRLHIGSRTVRSLAHSGFGRLFLANYAPERVRALFRRINAEQGEGEPILRYSDFERDLATIRQLGYSLMTKGVNPGAGSVSVMLPQREGCPPLAVGVGGLSETIEANCERLVIVLRRAISRHLDVIVPGGAIDE
jgi:IclR family transcriptional regulator, acetate operon repressor